MAKDKDVTAMLDAFEAIAVKEHDEKQATVAAVAVDDSRATALLSMTKSDKERPTAIAKTHGYTEPVRVLQACHR